MLAPRARARVQSHFLSENRFALLVLILTTLPRACTRRKILVATSAAYSLKKLINAYYAPKKVKLSFFCPLTILTGVRWPRAPSMYRIHRCAHHPPHKSAACRSLEIKKLDSIIIYRRRARIGACILMVMTKLRIY